MKTTGYAGTALLPFLARVPLLLWALCAVVPLYLLLIGLLTLTAVYGKGRARRRAAAEMVRTLWFAGGEINEQPPSPDQRA
ncbi:hypothetical protein DV517_09960 [Streptomyces sp. S816]|uniref:hypothetical protein n=1 Tax=Streptomyces sp. S816 TaxID=2283197 RepID=UPI00109D1B8E|nr:hypothetical protein [Streptomyces sp. S816]TGZ16023.1 hypothetical protein DV517_09960 [Streptomyces sp. S816]